MSLDLNVLLEICKYRMNNNCTYFDAVKTFGLQFGPDVLRSRIKKEIPEFNWNARVWEKSINYQNSDTVHRTVIISDVHYNIRDVNAVNAVTNFIVETKPDVVVLLGDIFDGELLSTYAKAKKKVVVDIGEEITQARDWLNLLCENAKRVIFIQGNHEERLSRTENREPGLPKEALEWRNLFNVYKVSDKLEVFDPRNTRDGFLRIGSAALMHGVNYGTHQAYVNITKEYGHEKLVVQGHSHTPALYYWKGNVGVVNGHLSNPIEQSYIHNPKWTAGFTIIEQFNNFEMFNVYMVAVTNGMFSYGGKLYKG